MPDSDSSGLKLDSTSTTLSTEVEAPSHHTLLTQLFSVGIHIPEMSFCLEAVGQRQPDPPELVAGRLTGQRALQTNKGHSWSCRSAGRWTGVKMLTVGEM